MKKIVFTILVIQFSFLVANAQWVQTNGPGIVYSLASNGNYIFAGTDHGVYRSTNNGNNWTVTTLSNGLVYSLAISENYIFAGTSIIFPGYGCVYRSTNNGYNWVQTELNNRNISSLVISGNNIFAGTEIYGVWRSTNNGYNWVQTGLNDGNVMTLAISGSNIFAGKYIVNDMGVYRSTDSGNNWVYTSLNKTIFSLAISGIYIFAGTQNYGVYRSQNNGNNWIVTTLNGGWIYSLVINGSNVFAGVDWGGVYLSTNYGNNWVGINQGFNTLPTVRSLLITSDYLFAGTEGSSVWRRPLVEVIGIQNISSEIPSSFYLSQNYPNPFNPTTKIKFDIPAKTVGQTFLSVYDILGKEVATLVNESALGGQPGTYSVDFDGTNFPSGVYFYKIIAGDFVSVKRMVLIK